LPETLALNIKWDILTADHLRVEKYWKWKNVNNPFSRLYIATDGQGQVSFDNKTYDLRPGQMLLIPCFEFHDYRCDDFLDHYFIHFTSRLDGGMDLFTIQKYQYLTQSGDREIELIKRLLELYPDRRLEQIDPTHPVHRKLEIYKDAHTDKERIIPGQVISDLIEGQSILQQLLIPFLKTAHGHNEPGKLYAVRRLHDVLQYIENNLNQNITLENMAKIAHLNKTYFSNSFYKLMGTRPIKYLNRKRIEKAQLLLWTSKQPICVIAKQVGFDDGNYFSRVFRKTTGLSPAKYRDQILSH
jgi:AraC-like DNA-binding protein